MSADVLGGRLLEEVQEEQLPDLLSDLRKLANPLPSSVLGLPQLDRLLEIFRLPNLSSAARGPRLSSPVEDESISPSRVGHFTPAIRHRATSLMKNRTASSVIQLTDNNSAAGKTSLCYLLTTLALLPKDYSGKRHGVVWFDTDGRLSATRLHSVLINYLLTNFPTLRSRESDAICNEALRHLHVFRPQSSSQLVSSLVSLPDYLLGTDSATAFYWQDRFDAEIARFEALGTDENVGARSSARSSGTLEAISELRKLQRVFECTILFTSIPHVRSTAFANSAVTTNDGRLLPQEPPRVNPWTAFATLNLSVSREHVRQFAAQMSLEECDRDQANRLAAIVKARSIVSVDWSTSVTWASGVRDAVNRLDGQGSFAMRITSRGIDVEE